MFLLENQIGQEIRNFREELKLTKEKLARLSKIGVKTLRQLENGKRTEKIETVIKIKDAFKKNFNVDFFEKGGIEIVWNFEDLDQKALNIIAGSLLGDGCIAKYETSRKGIYLQEAKDKKYLEWLGELLNKNGVKYKVIPTKHKNSYSKSKTFYCLYTHSCPAFFELRKRWYINSNKGKSIKRIPADIELTPATLLHWYLGDGNLKHDKRLDKRGGRPTVRLCTNAFVRVDIELLLRKLEKDLDLHFYSLPKLNKNIKRGYVLHLYPNDLFKFFTIIGQKPPVEIENSITKEIMGGKISTFNEKWPNKFDWIKISARTKGVGKLLKERRKELGLTQRDVARKIGVKKHHISEIECGRKQMSLKCFTKILDILKLTINETFIDILSRKVEKIVTEKLKEGLTTTDLIEAIPEVIR